MVRGRSTGHPRNYEKPVRGNAVWETAAKLATDMGAEGGAEAVRKSYTLINRAGVMRNGIRMTTLQSYRDALEWRDRNRRKRRKIN